MKDKDHSYIEDGSEDKDLKFTTAEDYMREVDVKEEQESE